MTLKEARFVKDLSQWELALISSVHQSRISLLENSLIAPWDYEKILLEEALGTKIEWPDIKRKYFKEE